MINQTLPLFPSEARKKLFGILIVISPPQNIAGDAEKLKHEFYRKYGSYESRHSKPHITLCNFILPEDRLDKVLASLQKDISQIRPFLLSLSGFGSFTGSNVIYMDVAESEELSLVRAFFVQKKAELKLGRPFSAPKKPHLTIAKNLKPGIFEAAAPEYLARTYRNVFMVTKLKVLGKELKTETYVKYRDLGDLRLGGENNR